MKEMNNTYLPYKLQFFAEGEEENTDVEETEDNSDTEEETKEEKTLTQEEVNKAIEKRLAREKKKWLKEQTENKQTENNSQAEPENPKLKEAEEKAAMLEVKMLAYEAGVTKDSVDDVVALAKAYVNDDTDLEDAIEKVLKKYPQFKGQTEETEKPKSWGDRQKGNANKLSDVEEAFYKKNPDLRPN